MKIYAIINNLYTNTFDTLFYESLKDDSVDMKFVVIPFKQPGTNETISMSALRQYMESKNYPYIEGYNEETGVYYDLYNEKPDAVFLQSPYDLQRISKLYSSKYLYTFTNVYHISYGSTMLNYDFPPYDNLLTNALQYFDACFAESTDLVKTLDKYNPNKYVPVGYAKCDKYLNYRNNPDFKFKPKDEEYDLSIAWKPRWVATLGDSNFLKYFYSFVDYFSQNQNYQLIFVKHQLMENTVCAKQIATQKEIRKMFGTLENMKNVKIIEDDDFLDYVMNADIFVGDYCSTIMEFALTGKPVIYTPTEVILSDYGKEILKGMYIADNFKEISNIIENIKNGEDDLKDVRQNVKNLISDTPPNGMTIGKYILEYIKNADKKVENPEQRAELLNEKIVKKEVETETKIKFKDKIRLKIYKRLYKTLHRKNLV